MEARSPEKYFNITLTRRQQTDTQIMILRYKDAVFNKTAENVNFMPRHALQWVVNQV